MQRCKHSHLGVLPRSALSHALLPAHSLLVYRPSGADLDHPHESHLSASIRALVLVLHRYYHTAIQLLFYHVGREAL